DSGSVAVFVSDDGPAEKVAGIRSAVPTLKHVITFGGRTRGADMTLGELEEKGRAVDDAHRRATYRERALAIRPDDLATIIYTSGTTGDPKGVMLTHDNLYSNVMAAKSLIPFAGQDVALSFLPLSHSFERMAGHYLMMATGTSVAY